MIKPNAAPNMKDGTIRDLDLGSKTVCRRNINLIIPFILSNDKNYQRSKSILSF